MGELKQMNIKNRTDYFYNDIIDIDEFDGSKIKVDKKNFNDNIRKKITECNEINSINPLHLVIKFNSIEHINEGNKTNKY